MPNQKFYLDKIKQFGDTIADFVVNNPGIAKDTIMVFDRDESSGFTEFYEKLVNLGKDYFHYTRSSFDFDIFELITPFNWELWVDLIWIRIIEKLHETEKGKEILQKIYGEPTQEI
jgi:hypothetical protein